MLKERACRGKIIQIGGEELRPLRSKLKGLVNTGSGEMLFLKETTGHAKIAIKRNRAKPSPH